MTYETIKFEIKDNIGYLTLSVPEKLNAHTHQMRRELLQFWRDRQNDEENCRVVIMTGEGRAFCSGSDIDEMDDEYRPFYKRYAEELYQFQDQISEVVLLMRRAPQPIIAAVRGWAAGGGFSFTLAADIRLADPTAKFVAAYINIGLSAADMGSSYYLPREVNLGFAAEYLYTGEPIDAATADKIGLVNYVLPPEKLMPKAEELAKKMAEKSVLGLRMTKEAINQNIGGVGLQAALQIENRNQVICLAARPIKNPFKKKK
ncbi:MAG: enoyl-CoA hydratase/isomerase family protein [Desulfarculaceae bacterium]|jgi:enoyl-CoA hydratase